MVVQIPQQQYGRGQTSQSCPGMCLLMHEHATKFCFIDNLHVWEITGGNLFVSQARQSDYTWTWSLYLLWGCINHGGYGIFICATLPEQTVVFFHLRCCSILYCLSPEHQWMRVVDSPKYHLNEFWVVLLGMSQTCKTDCLCDCADMWRAVCHYIIQSWNIFDVSGKLGNKL